MWHTGARPWTLFDPEFVGDALDPDRASAMWAGHRWFAYDLIRWGRPELVVELGTQYGPSFFTFCQAVRDEGCTTTLHAIDTWKGDSFTGAYGEEVFAIVQRVDSEAFADLETHLHRCRFDDALDEFADESVDLLHIDGVTTTRPWPATTRRGCPRSRRTGWFSFMTSILTATWGRPASGRSSSNTHPSFEFTHSCGLGVLFPKGTTGFEYLLGDEFERWRAYYPARAGDVLGLLRYRDQTQMIDERDALIADQDRIVAARRRAHRRTGGCARSQGRRARAAGRLHA